MVEEVVDGDWGLTRGTLVPCAAPVTG